MDVELPLRVVVTILECCVTSSGVKLSIRSFVLFVIPSDGKIIMCTKKPVIHFSQNCTCAKRNSQWASTYQRNLRCHHSMAARCLEYNAAQAYSK